MNPLIAWALAVAVLVGAWFGYGWHGVALAVTLMAFGLLLQFNRLVRVMRRAAESPLGQVDNAVMLHAQLHAGLPMAKVVALTKSLGRRHDDGSETYTWTDAGGASVTITFVNGRCTQWALTRAPEPEAVEAPNPGESGPDRGQE
ncbi:MAG TPA: hypothetical protein VGM74_02505 [Burkholderiaceae bacterium]|jgi:uncharacterized protein (DUF58 family)